MGLLVCNEGFCRWFGWGEDGGGLPTAATSYTISGSFLRCSLPSLLSLSSLFVRGCCLFGMKMAAVCRTAATSVGADDATSAKRETRGEAPHCVGPTPGC